MAKYQLHYAGSTFELPDARSAVEITQNADAMFRTGKGGRMSIRTTEGLVVIYVGPGVPLAVSGLSETEAKATAG